MAEEESLSLLLEKLNLVSMKANWKRGLEIGKKKGWSPSQYLSYLCEEELALKYGKKIARYKKESQLAVGKSFRTFKFEEVGLEASKLVPYGEEKEWLKEKRNVLIFGPSGVGKTHLAVAIGEALIDKEVRVKFYRGSELVEELQEAKKELKMEKHLERLSKYELLIIDDIGYVKKNERETSVLFELISQRYETGSLVVTSNLAFSEWDKIFSDTTMAVGQ
jgi:DNA replication protein DnaC